MSVVSPHWNAALARLSMWWRSCFALTWSIVMNTWSAHNLQFQSGLFGTPPPEPALRPPLSSGVHVFALFAARLLLVLPLSARRGSLSPSSPSVPPVVVAALCFGLPPSSSPPPIVEQTAGAPVAEIPRDVEPVAPTDGALAGLLRTARPEVFLFTLQ